MKKTLSRYIAHDTKGFLILFVLLLALFSLLQFFLGTAHGFMMHDRCFELLGCNVDAVGFDGLVHFVSGLAAGVFFALLVRGAHKHRTISRNFVGLFLFALTTVLAWELTEWLGDALQVGLLFDGLLYGTNTSFQPSHADTIGDMILGTAGTLIAGVMGVAFRRDTAREGMGK